MSGALLEVRGLCKTFHRSGARAAGVVRAVDEVSLAVQTGETVGLVGESGSGKSTLARCVLGLLRPTRGEVYFEGQRVTGLSRRALRPLRRRMQIVFQDPTGALNPRLTVRAMLAEPIRVHGLARGAAVEERVRALLGQVGLGPEALDRYPHEFSGGQRQRLVLARALSVEPVFLVADEPVSALDMSVRAQVMNLLLDLKASLGFTLLFIAHDLDLVRHVSDRVAVMYLGRIVELATVERLFAAPAHPYTRALLAAVPRPSAPLTPAALLPDAAPVAPLGEGCAFRPRCPLADARCAREAPSLRSVAGHEVACHRA